MTTIKLILGWPTRRLLDFGFSLSNEELDNLRSLRSRYVRVSGNSNTVCIGNMFRGNNLVEDVDRYRIRLVQNRPMLIPHLLREISPETNRHNDIRPQQGGNTLVVLLESPSKHEYDGAPNRPIAPAQGQTGCGLLCHLGSILEKAIQTSDDDNYLRDHLSDDTKLVISNPIQFEPSLRYAIRGDAISESKRRRLTNAIWRALWSVPEIKWRFLRRLRSYNPSIIINSCTSPLGSLVCQYLAANRNIRLPHIYRTYHPSSLCYSNHGLNISTC